MNNLVFMLFHPEMKTSFFSNFIILLISFRGTEIHDYRGPDYRGPDMHDYRGPDMHDYRGYGNGYDMDYYDQSLPSRGSRITPPRSPPYMRNEMIRGMPRDISPPPFRSPPPYRNDLNMNRPPPRDISPIPFRSRSPPSVKRRDSLGGPENENSYPPPAQGNQLKHLGGFLKSSNLIQTATQTFGPGEHGHHQHHSSHPLTQLMQPRFILSLLTSAPLIFFFWLTKINRIFDVLSFFYI